jgi:hypothetical protein
MAVGESIKKGNRNINRYLSNFNQAPLFNNVT